MTNFDLKLSRFNSDNKLTRKEVEKDIHGYVYDVTEITEGSEKQISWAKDIQIEAINIIGRIVGISKKQGGWTDETIPIMERIVKNIFTHTDARFFIDNRNNFMTPSQIFEHFEK